MTDCRVSHVTLLANVFVILSYRVLHLKPTNAETCQSMIMQLYSLVELHTNVCWIQQDGTSHHMVQTMDMLKMVYCTTTVATCHLVCGWEVILRVLLISDSSPFHSLLEGFQHHSLLPEVNYWKPFITNLPPYYD
jgi:hypothetical protein